MYLRVVMLAVALCWVSAADAATVMIDSTSDDSVGQSIVYNLRNQIAKSALHKLVYSKDDAGFVISIVTMRQGDGSSVYSAVLTVPPFDKKGMSYYVDHMVGYCGSSVTESCAQRILTGFDGDMSEVATAVQNALKQTPH